MISAIVLAAGCSTRMGTPKQLLNFHGRPLLRLVTENLLMSKVDEVIVVLGHQAEEVGLVLAGLPVKLVINAHYLTGQSSSIKSALAAIFPPGDDTQAAAQSGQGIMFVLGDQPLVQPATLDCLIEHFLAPSKTKGPGKIVLPYYQGCRGNPTLFDSTYCPEFWALTGDIGAREIILRHPEAVMRVEVTDQGVVTDIDTWADYKKWGEDLT